MKMLLGEVDKLIFEAGFTGGMEVVEGNVIRDKLSREWQESWVELKVKATILSLFWWD